jgi:hypothetical protein
MVPKRGDRVTLHTRDGEYIIAVCFPPVVGILSDAWPVGASQQVALHELATVNGRAVEFAQPEQSQKRRGGGRKAA